VIKIIRNTRKKRVALVVGWAFAFFASSRIKVTVAMLPLTTSVVTTSDFSSLTHSNDENPIIGLLKVISNYKRNISRAVEGGGKVLVNLGIVFGNEAICELTPNTADKTYRY